MNQRFFLNFITLFIAASSLGLVLPSNAASFVNFSQTELTVSNFSQLPQYVDVLGNIKVVSIVEVGTVEIQVDGGAIFLIDDLNSIAFGYSGFQTSMSGTGVKYLGRTDIISNLIGGFQVKKNTTFSFNIDASVLLANWTENLQFSPVSTSANQQLILQDVLNQEDWLIFDFLGFLNTNSIDTLNQHEFTFNVSPSLNILAYQEETSFRSNNESLQFFLKASFEKQVSQDAELVLFTSNRLCNYGSDVTDVCVSVPEPSNSLGLFVVGFFWLNSVFSSSRIMKHIVKLTH